MLTKEEGGRHKPFFSNYRPQFYFRTTDVTGTINLPEGTEMCMPGDNTKMIVELIAPIAMDEGLRFAIREGGRTVGAGAVTKILDVAASSVARTGLPPAGPLLERASGGREGAVVEATRWMSEPSGVRCSVGHRRRRVTWPGRRERPEARVESK